MADANSVEAKMDGIDGARKPYPYRVVRLNGEYQGPNSSGAGPAVNTPSLFDQIVTTAKILDRRYKGLDLFDMVVALYQAAGEPQPK